MSRAWDLRRGCTNSPLLYHAWTQNKVFQQRVKNYPFFRSFILQRLNSDTYYRDLFHINCIEQTTHECYITGLRGKLCCALTLIIQCSTWFYLYINVPLLHLKWINFSTNENNSTHILSGVDKLHAKCWSGALAHAKPFRRAQCFVHILSCRKRKKQ